MGKTGLLNNVTDIIMVVEKIKLCYSNKYRLATRMEDVNELYYFRFGMESGG